MGGAGVRGGAMALTDAERTMAAAVSPPARIPAQPFAETQHALELLPACMLPGGSQAHALAQRHAARESLHGGPPDNAGARRHAILVTQASV